VESGIETKAFREASEAAILHPFIARLVDGVRAHLYLFISLRASYPTLKITDLEYQVASGVCVELYNANNVVKNEQMLNEYAESKEPLRETIYNNDPEKLKDCQSNKYLIEAMATYHKLHFNFFNFSECIHKLPYSKQHFEAYIQSFYALSQSIVTDDGKLTTMISNDELNEKLEPLLLEYQRFLFRVYQASLSRAHHIDGVESVEDVSRDPPPRVDLVWHVHVLRRQYEEEMKALLGFTLYHMAPHDDSSQ
jgi:hypothetical protein